MGDWGLANVVDRPEYQDWMVKGGVESHLLGKENAYISS